MAKLTEVKVDLKLPYIGGVSGTWEPDESEKKAAWEMYVELVTRVATVNMYPGECVLREALTSFHSLFDTTRKILRQYGPGIAQPKGKDDLSFGYLAVVILNTVLRPLLAKWHPLLLDYENARNPTVSCVEHERGWEKYQELWDEIANVRRVVVEYADLLAEVAGIPSLIVRRESR